MNKLVAALALALLPLTALADAATPAAPAPRPVVSEIVTADPARQRAFPGVIAGENQAMLAFLTAGRLASLPVEAGDRVARGDTLAVLDQITLEQDLAAARAGLEAAEAKATLAAQQYDRVETLRGRGVATQAQLDQVRAGRDASAAQAESARATLARAQDAAGYGTLTAPRDGIVLSVLVEPGATVSAGIPVVELADPVGREALIDVPEDFAALLPEDASFALRRHAQTTAPTLARVTVMEPVTETSLGTRRLRLTLDDPPEDFRIGSLIEASFAADGAPVMTLPRVAIAEGPSVWRVEGAARRVRRVAVELGDRVVILGGIIVGDEIVTRGVHSLTEGQNVGDRLE